MGVRVFRRQLQVFCQRLNVEKVKVSFAQRRIQGAKEMLEPHLCRDSSCWELCLDTGAAPSHRMVSSQILPNSQVGFRIKLPQMVEKMSVFYNNLYFHFCTEFMPK